METRGWLAGHHDLDAVTALISVKLASSARSYRVTADGHRVWLAR